MLMTLTMYTGLAHAQNVREVVTPWDDPLRTRPDVLKQGPTFPGDQTAIDCAELMSDHDEQQGLSLADVLDIGLCSNPQVRSAWADIKIQAAALGEAKGAYLPTVSGGLSRLNDRTSYPGGNLDPTSVHGNAENMGLNWRLFDFGGRAANKRQQPLY